MYCVSFDVSNLFTNVPIKETIDIVCRIVCSHDDFPYTYKELHTLLTLVNESIFEFDGKTYRQIDGISMGNPLAPILADFFMGSIEEKLFANNRDFYPERYFRYVDDTLCLFDNAEDINKFLNCLNGLHDNISFTCERSVNDTMPFLDVQLSFTDNIITTAVYRKNTFTGRLLNYKSIAPKIWKIGLIKTMIYRAYHLSSSWKKFHEEIMSIKDIFAFNDYPFWQVDKIIKKFLNSHFNHENDEATNKAKEQNFIVIKIPYYGKATLTLKRNINKLLRRFENTKVKICFTCRRLRSVLPIKEKSPIPLRSSVIYKFCCSRDPNVCYIGETGRQLVRRINEHMTTNSAVSSHLNVCNACPTNCDALTENFTIIYNAGDNFDRVIAEALLIKKLKPSLNTQCMSGKKTFCLQLF